MSTYTYNFHYSGKQKKNYFCITLMSIFILSSQRRWVYLYKWLLSLAFLLFSVYIVYYCMFVYYSVCRHQPAMTWNRLAPAGDWKTTTTAAAATSTFTRRFYARNSVFVHFLFGMTGYIHTHALHIIILYTYCHYELKHSVKSSGKK